MSEEEYLESFIDGYNLEILREQKEAEMRKIRNGTWSTEEIIEAMDIILNGWYLHNIRRSQT